MNCRTCNNPIDQSRIEWAKSKGYTVKDCKDCSEKKKAAKAQGQNPYAFLAPEQKAGVDWDKIALGKIAHGFLIEAYKQIKSNKGNALDVDVVKAAQNEAYLWAQSEIAVQNRLSTDLKAQ